MASYSTKGLDHLGLVAGMNKELGVAKIIDKTLPEQCDDKLITYGQLVEAMILNGLGFVVALCTCTRNTLKTAC
ncbi:MAG: hypothetical protein ACI9LM_001658 [Alteromonadaceae bacterium]|jgi:hypothetical protein